MIMTFGNMRFLSAWLLSIIIIFSLTQQSVNANELSKEEEDYLKKNGPLIFVSQTNYPPFEFLGSDGDRTGMCIDLVRWIATEFGFKVNFTDTSFKQAQDDVLSGKAHILTSLFYSEKRDQVFDFTKTVFTVPASIFVMAERPDIKDINDLQGKIIAIQSGDYAQEFLESKGIKCSYKYTTDFAKATDLVIADKADAIIGDEQIVLYHIFSSDLTDRIKKVGEPLYIGQNCMGAKGPNPILIGIMNKGIELAQNKGVLDQIYKKWIGMRYSPKHSWLQQFFPYFLYLMAGFILVTVLVWVWNIRLRKKVFDRTSELTRSEETLRTILNASPLGISIARGRILGWHNEAMSRMLGYPQGELEGQDIKVLYQGNHHLEQAGYWSKVPVQQNSVNSVETCWIRKDGSVFPCQLRSAPLRLQDDKSMTISIAEDITERKQAEEALRESEEKLKAIFEANPAPVVVYDGIGHPLYLNPAFTEVFGWSLKELQGELIPFVPEDQEEITKLQIKEIYKFGKPVRFETKRLSKHGGTINVLLSAAIIKNFQGINSGLVVNLTDITEQKKIEALLRQSQKMEAIGTLAGGIAHDFNNILSGIFGYTQMAGMNLNDPVKIKKNLDQVTKGAQRATELVQQILTISRQVDYKKNLLKLNVIVKEAVKFLHSSIPTTIEIIEKISSRAIVLADPTQVYQVVMNLCTNAYHSMSDTGGTLTVELSDVDIPPQDPLSGNIQKSGKYVKLEVRDTGHGMNKETLEKIFDPYFTTKKPDKGTGLGLAVVDGIVKKHNGFVKAFSELGHGSKFQIFLPRIEKGDTAVIPETQQPDLNTGTEKIMLVDDEENILDTTKSILEEYGYKITVFKEGNSAFQTFAKDPNYFDLVITDMSMPNMAGDRLSAELIKIRPDIPILLCTGFSETISEEKALSLGIKGFLLKPIVMKDLAQKIREVLDEN